MRKLRIDDQTERASRAGISRRTQQKQDAIARRAPALFREVRAGRKSTDAAYRDAGLGKQLTPFDQVSKLLPKLNSGPEEAAGRPATVAIPFASPGAAVRPRLRLLRWGAQGRSLRP